MRTFLDILKFVVAIFPYIIELVDKNEERKEEQRRPEPNPDIYTGDIDDSGDVLDNGNTFVDSRI